MQQPDPAQIQHLMLTMAPVIGFFILVGWAVVIIPFWQIFKKAGMAGPMALLMLVPLVNIVMLYVLGFSRWKVIPAPDYGAGYLPTAYPPSAYPPGYAPPAAGYPPATPRPPAAASPAYVPPADPPAAV